MAKTKGVSLRPKDQQKGQGLWPSVPSRATIANPHFEKVDFTNKEGVVMAKQVPCLVMTFKPADGSEARTETYSCGNGWKVTDERLIPQNGQTGLNDGCNAALFFNALEDAGFDMETIGDDVTVLDGVEAILHRVARPKVDEKSKDKTIVVVKELVEDEAPKKKGTAKSKAKDEDDDEDEDDAPKSKAKSKKPAVDDDEDDEDEAPKKGAAKKPAAKGKSTDVAETAKEALIEAVQEGGGKLKVGKVADAVADVVKGHPDRKAIVEWVEDEDNLQEEDGWEFDGKVVTVEA